MVGDRYDDPFCGRFLIYQKSKDVVLNVGSRGAKANEEVGLIFDRVSLFNDPLYRG